LTEKAVRGIRHNCSDHGDARDDQDGQRRTGTARPRLEKASGYFYFWSGDAADWIDRTVRVEKISDLTLERWVAEYKRLKKVNAEMMRSPKASKKAQ
jgi:hypothetical protein